MSVIRDWREAVHTHLAASFPAADVVSGRRTGVARDRDVIAVFWPGWRVNQRDIALATPTLTIRYWPARSKQPSTTSPPDPGDLEDAAAALMEAMRDKRKSGDFVAGLACFVSEVTPVYDDDEWMVEATVQALALHPAARSA